MRRQDQDEQADPGRDDAADQHCEPARAANVHDHLSAVRQAQSSLSGSPNCAGKGGGVVHRRAVAAAVSSAGLRQDDRHGRRAAGTGGDADRRLYACTPSRLTTWLDCPRRYRLTYLDRPQPAKGAAVGAQQRRRQRAQRAGPVVVAGQRPTAPRPAAGRLLDTGWIGEGFRDDAQSDRARHRARELVEGYVATLDPDDEPVGCERTVGDPYGQPCRCPGGSTASTGGRPPTARRRAGHRRLQDRPAPAVGRRRPVLAGVGGLRRGGCPDAAQPVAPGRAAPPADG